MFDEIYENINEKKKINEGVDSEDIDRFEEIISEIASLVEEAFDITLQAADRSISARARSYWRGHIQGALGENYSEYLGGSMTTMEETLSELREDAGLEKEE